MDFGIKQAIEDLGWLGRVASVENIGKYQVVTYYAYKTKNGDRIPGTFSKWPTYHGYYDGKNFNTSYGTIEECLAGTMAYVNDGLNSKAGKYFCISIGVIPFNKEE